MQFKSIFPRLDVVLVGVSGHLHTGIEQSARDFCPFNLKSKELKGI